MAIEFVVEDGTGLTNSTRYASVAQYKQYWLNRGVTATGTDDEIKGYLNLATQYIDNSYNFKSSQKNISPRQALQWPRIDIYDQNCVVVSGIPVELVNATCELASQAASGYETVDTGIRSESYGPVSVTYSGSSQKRFPKIEKMLRFYTAPRELDRVN